MTSLPDESADALADELRSLGTPERAVAEQRYLKSDRIHYGTSMPNIRSVAKRFLAVHPAITHDELVAVCRALWNGTEPSASGRRSVHERCMLAVELLDLRPKLLSVHDLATIEGFFRESGTWALVDGLAAHVAADIVATTDGQAALDVLDRWVVDDDFWVRRAAVLALGTELRAGRQLDRFFRYADLLLPEREFFIRKVLGWVARETGRRHPDEVGAWLRRNLHRMNGVTIREAVKHLPDGDEILAAWKAR